MGGIVGPAAFIGAWVAGTVVLDGYSPITDAISRLAALSLGVAVLATTTLAATPFVEASGLLQRVGLTSLDVWLVSVSTQILTGRLGPGRTPAPASGSGRPNGAAVSRPVG